MGGTHFLKIAIFYFSVFLLISQTSSHLLKQNSPNLEINLLKDDPLLIKTHSGLLRGESKTILGKEVHTFLGIPFAKPPVGQRRFRNPEPVDPWHGVLNATSLPNSCQQQNFASFPGFPGEEMWNPNTPTSEDCLYLNIWVPAQLRNNDIPATTMIWIYGGGFMSGTSTLELYDGSILSVTNDVIVVSLQYRVGAFGFLHLGTEEAPGNMGLFDQYLAIKWTRENIGAFGGNTESLTLFGESAGSASVSYHLLSPLSRPLVKRAILQSGFSNTPWSFTPTSTAKETALALAAVVGCNTTVVEAYNAVVECLRTIDGRKLSLAQNGLYKLNLEFPFVPTIDGVFLPNNPVSMIDEGDFSHTEILLGSVSDEGSFFLVYEHPKYFNKDNETSLSRDQFIEIINSTFANFSPLIRDSIVFQYTDWDRTEDGCPNQKSFSDAVGDYNFVCPANNFANKFAERGLNVYYYYFTQRSSSNPWGKWMGVLHGDEIEYVFGVPLNPSLNFTASEIDLSRRMMNHFATFAKTGKPVTDDSESQWPPYSRKTPHYHIFDAKVRGLGRGPRATVCAFWNEFIPQVQARQAEETCTKPAVP